MRPPPSLSRLKAAFFGRSARFMLLALALATANTYASTLAASLFLARAGADSLPLYYMLFAALSIPLSLFFSTIIDRWARALTLQAMLIGFAIMAALLALLADVGEGGLYALYIGVSICELLTYSVYYVLVADYFTPTEAKRQTGTIAICMAGGGLLGGSLVGVAIAALPAGGALLVAPVLIVVTLIHLAWVTRREMPLDETESEAEESLFDALKMQPKIAKRFPIVPLLAGAVFLNVLLQCFSEYIAFSIYAQTFKDETDLATFLGLINAALNIFGVLVVFVFTTPMITRMGVARFNLVFPAANLAALATVIVDQRLPAAILAHIAYDPLEHSVDVPVFMMNYNAVPYRFVGRVRVFNDGVAHPLALAAAGAALLVLTPIFDLAEMAALATGIGIAFLAVHWGIGRNYLQSLINMLRTGTIDLDRTDERFRLPAHYRQDVQAMLASDDPEIVGLALEIVARSEIAVNPLDLERALASVPVHRELSVLRRIARARRGETAEVINLLANSGHAQVRAAAVEVLATDGHAFPAGELAKHLADPDPNVRLLATTVQWLDHPTEHAAGSLLALTENSAGARGACRILGARGDARAVPLLLRLGDHADGTVTATMLDTMGALVERDAPPRIEQILPFTESTDPAIRTGAYGLLAKFVPAHRLAEVTRRAFADPAPEVRHGAAVAFGRRGEDAVPALQAALEGSPEQRDVAIEGLGIVGGRTADDISLPLSSPVC